MISRRSLMSAAGALAVAPLAAPALAQGAWPNRPVRLIVTFPPGGASDIVARLVGAPLSEKLGQSVVIDNRPGGGTTIGVNAMLNAKDEFHSLLIANSAPLSIAPWLFDKPPYDATKDFTHIFYIGSVANCFAVHSSVPAKTMPELVQWIRDQNKPVPFGSGGSGSIGHIVGEMFKAELGLNMEHIGYKGSAPMFQDLLGGQLLLAVNTLPEVWALAKDGKLRVIALTSTQRPKIAPDIPLVGELGYPKLIAENYIGISGPANTPPAVVAKVHAAMTEVMKDPKVTARLEDLGFSTKPMASAEFAAFVAKQAADFKQPVLASGAKLN